MTNITGKIYQQTNDDGTENRFPKTVVPAVIGLSQYLQDQFNTLSDLYMPKEGENESKTGQEITYRKSEATINAKTVTIDRIYGKSLAWNQNAGEATYDSSLVGQDTSVTHEKKYIVSTTRDSSSRGVYVGSGYNVSSDHKVYVRFICKSNYTNAPYLRIMINSNPATYDSIYLNNYEADKWCYGSKIEQGFCCGGSTGILPSNNGYVAGEYISIPNNNKFVLAIDLTLMFGAGLEPTKAQFEEKYLDYIWKGEISRGALIDNDTECIETVGRNLFDEKTQTGYWSGSDGSYHTASAQSCSKHPIRVLPNTKYYRRAGNQSVTLIFFDKNMLCIGYQYVTNDAEITTPNNCEFVHLNFEPAYGAYYKYDTCFNISDSSFNGQYEPYYKNELKLDLNNIKVKSHNIWDEEWEVGVWNITNGEKTSNNDTIRSKGFIKVFPGDVYYFKAPYNFTVCKYNSNKTFLGYFSVRNNTYTIPSDTEYITFYINSASYSTTYNNDICINVSSSFNGRYEPYGTVIIEGGLKGTDDVYDEIVGNKFIKRFERVDMGTINYGYQQYSSAPQNNYFRGPLPYSPLLTIGKRTTVCSKYTTIVNRINGSELGYAVTGPGAAIGNLQNNICINDTSYSDTATFKTAMSGVMLDYALLAPIEYELAEPLTYTFKAGTTEERVSPNSDGLSAPFCCDLTYNASETAGVLDALQGLSRKLELIEERLARLEDNE